MRHSSSVCSDARDHAKATLRRAAAKTHGSVGRVWAISGDQTDSDPPNTDGEPHEQPSDDTPKNHGPDTPAPVKDAESVFTRIGDPDEFEDELTGEVVDPNDLGGITVPPGFLRRLLADPAHAPELLAARAVEQFADRAERDVRLLRDRNPRATDRQLAVYFKRKYSRAARWEGAGTGTAGLLGLPADLVMLAWIQNRLVISIAAAYGHDMTDHRERAVELLMIQGIHNSRDIARRRLIGITQKTVKKLILKHLRKQALVLIKQMFRVVGINFTRKALLEKGVPLLSVPISAGVNYVSTRLAANQAIKFYDTTIG